MIRLWAETSKYVVESVILPELTLVPVENVDNPQAHQSRRPRLPTLAELRKHSAWAWVVLRAVLASLARRFRPAHDPMGRRRIERQAEALR